MCYIKSGPMPRDTDGLSVPAVSPSDPNLTQPYAKASQMIPDDSQEDSPSHGDPAVRYSGEEPQHLLLDQQNITIRSDPKSDLFLELGL